MAKVDYWEIVSQQAIWMGYGTDLNNLALLLQDTDRLAEAEPLMRRGLIIFVRSLGTEHPSSRTVKGNYIGLLQAMGRTEDEITGDFASLLQEF